MLYFVANKQKYYGKLKKKNYLSTLSLIAYYFFVIVFVFFMKLANNSTLD